MGSLMSAWHQLQQLLHIARAKTAFRMGDKATALRLLKLAKQCDAECAAEAATLSSDFALAAERASTGSNALSSS